ncbi:MAG: FtsW/RodA/SpoVE family cell cycle protein [Prevotella sp.]
MNKKLGNLFKGDKVIWMIFFFLCLVSIVEVFSASSFLTFRGGSYLGPLVKHASCIFLGLCAMLGVLNIPCKYFKIVTLPMLVVSFVLLVIVLLLGESTNGASRWFGVAGIQFQPSEIAKGTLVLAVAQILSAMHTERGSSPQAFYWVLITSSFIIIPIFFENLSTAALLAFVVLMMMIIARVPMRLIGSALGIGFIIVAMFVLVVMFFGESTPAAAGNSDKTTLVESAEKTQQRSDLLHRADTWKARFKRWGNDEVKPNEFDLDRDAQVAHANIAIVKSNGIGRGPGNSEERDFLSQAFSDFIYAIIIEEMGIEGAAIIAILYVVLFFRVGTIAKNCVNTFPAFLAMGIAILLVTQALFNMMVAVGFIPVTGQPLPFISKGGTSTIINCVYIGMLLSISRSAKKKKPVLDVA